MSEIHFSERLRLYLIRHGEVERAEDGKVFGHTDVALSERGLEQSRKLADRLASTGLQAVYSSDLRRSVLLAEMIAGRHGLELQQDPLWREINMGEWEGRALLTYTARPPNRCSSYLLIHHPSRIREANRFLPLL